MDYVQLVKTKIDIDQIYNLTLDDGCGASSIFVGTTRDSFDGKKVISLEYEAYESMALKEMQKICTELRVRWPNLKHIALHHRLGSVPVREASVVIAVSSPHRAAALESVSFAIDQLKSHVPIWKKEIYEDDPLGEWKENKECQWPPKCSESDVGSFDLSHCKIDQNPLCGVDNSDKLVQIKVNDCELNRRVECFLKRKRDEINLYNINDFKKQSCKNESEEFPEESCARTQSFLIKQQQSNGHLKVRRVNNNCGPQVRPDYSHQLNKLMPTHLSNDLSEDSQSRYSRLKNIESYMGLKSDDNDSIISRIKNIENRILLLESSSPEYTNIVQMKTEENNRPVKKQKKKVYLSEGLDNIISKIKIELENKN